MQEYLEDRLRKLPELEIRNMFELGMKAFRPSASKTPGERWLVTILPPGSSKGHRRTEPGQRLEPIVDDKAKVLSTIDDMVSAFHKGDIDGIMRTYEPAAVVVGEPGKPASGTPALRAMFAGFIAAKARFTFLGHEVLQADDIALHLTPWRMTGIAPDGTAVAASGLSIAVLRRQADGRWLMVIDDPYGDALLNQATSR
jgi:uncharacterized protein (TIGR02246 family)